MGKKLNIKDYFEKQKAVIKEKRPNVRLGIVNGTAENDTANKIYIKNKIKDFEELGLFAMEIPIKERTSEAIEIIERERINNIIVQLPLRAGVIDDLIVKNEMDSDGLNKGNDFVRPATAKGIIDYLTKEIKYAFAGKSAVVLGRSNIVGKPIAEMLLERDCSVSIFHSKSKKEDIVHACQNADLIISAVGKIDFVTAEMVSSEKEKIIFDVGINRKKEGGITGDLSEGVKELPQITYSPVPSGVGLLTRLALAENCGILSDRFSD